MTSYQPTIKTGQTASGNFYSRVERDGRTRTYSDREVAAAIALTNAHRELSGRDGMPVNPWDPRARRILTAQQATAASRRTLGDVLREKKKPQKPKVDRYGWPVKGATETKEKLPAWQPTVQPEPERSTGFILPSVIIGGFSAHLQSPARWDVSVYKTATLSNNFLGFDLPEIKPIRDHLADLQKKLLGVEDLELQESEQCSWDQYPAAHSLMREQAQRGVSYSISCKARMNRLGYDRLKDILRIQEDGSQFDSATAPIELLGICWAGALQGPSAASTMQLELPPHILQEDGPVEDIPRAMILRHDGTPTEYIPRSPDGQYSHVEPDVIPYDFLELWPVTQAPPGNDNAMMSFDLDFITVSGLRWGVAITRYK